MSVLSIGVQFDPESDNRYNLLSDYVYPICSNKFNAPMRIYTQENIKLEWILKLYSDIPDAGRGKYYRQNPQLLSEYRPIRKISIHLYPHNWHNEFPTINKMFELTKRVFVSPISGRIDCSDLTSLSFRSSANESKIEYDILHLLARICRNLSSFHITTVNFYSTTLRLVKRLVARNKNLTKLRWIVDTYDSPVIKQLITIIDPSRQLRELHISTADMDNDLPRKLDPIADIPDYISSSHLIKATIDFPSPEIDNFIKITSCPTLTHLKLIIDDPDDPNTKIRQIMRQQFLKFLKEYPPQTDRDREYRIKEEENINRPVGIIYDRLNTLIRCSSHITHMIFHFVHDTPNLTYLIPSLSVNPNLQELTIIITECERQSPNPEVPYTLDIQSECNRIRKENRLRPLQIIATSHIICDE